MLLLLRWTDPTEVEAVWTGNQLSFFELTDATQLERRHQHTHTHTHTHMDTLERSVIVRGHETVQQRSKTGKPERHKERERERVYSEVLELSEKQDWIGLNYRAVYKKPDQQLWLVKKPATRYIRYPIYTVVYLFALSHAPECGSIASWRAAWRACWLALLAGLQAGSRSCSAI